MSFGEIIVILIVAILVLGPDKLPEAIVQIAKILKALKRNIDDAKSSIEKEVRINDLKEEAKK
ncbi:Sec-independent protein translocase subunit TatB, partial [Campylobacter coli]|nr:Sec-independent protein translocase subunit TatB [Campylobacter coli]